MRKEIHLVYPKKIGHIAPEIYGHFSEHIGGVFYDGLYVGRDSSVPNIHGFRREIIEKMREISAPVLRWPGGCFAEIYDWRDGIGENRPIRRSWWTPNDGRLESNAVGTHEFCELCELIGAKPYFAANLTASTPLEIRNWMDYCLSPRGTTTLAQLREKNGHAEPFDIPYWGVGNENWGGGGNMSPDMYAHEFLRYATLMQNVSDKVQLYACGSNGDHFDWTHGVSQMLENAPKLADGFAMHYYCGSAGEVLTFTEDEWTQMLRQADYMETILCRNWNILCAHNLQDKMKLVVDEWGCWHPEGSGPSQGYNLFEQQSTLRDAMVTALTLNIFNRHCDKVRMANVAQLVNNLHCLFLASGENCIVTPTYHVFKMFREHQNADAIEAVVTNNETFADSISVSASVKNGKTLLSIGNLSCTEAQTVTLSAFGENLPHSGRMTLLSAEDMHAHNTFEQPDAVQPTETDVDLTQPITIPKAGICTIAF